jgi:hypothetical protein
MTRPSGLTWRSFGWAETIPEAAASIIDVVVEARLNKGIYSFE